MPTIPEPSATQEILRVASAGLLALGGVAVASGLGVLKGRRGRKPAEPSPRHFAIGVVLVLGGVIAMAFRHDPAPEPEIITVGRFSSSRMPALSLVAPPPWRLEYDPATGRLLATRPGTKFLIYTQRVTDVNDRAAALDGVFEGLKKKGLTPAGEAFTQVLDGLPAIARLGVLGPASSALWVVERPGKLFAFVVCTSETGHDAVTACDPVLSTLSWRKPGPS